MDDFMDFAVTEDIVPQGPYLPEAMDCMRCGLCLNSCPTYQLSGDEQESPRGRVNSLRTLVQQNAMIDAEARQHLQSCLQCYACETVCPSQMNYRHFFEQGVQQLNEQHGRTLLANAAFYLISHKKALNRFLPLLKLYQTSGLQWMLRNFNMLAPFGLKRADELAVIPDLSRLPARFPLANPRGSVALFTSCISSAFDRETVISAIRVLNAIGYQVIMPESIQCCGAIHYHNGEQAQAASLMRANLDCLNSLEVDAVVYTASGCGSHLYAYPEMLSLNDMESRSLQARMFDVSDFVEQHWPDQLQLPEKTIKIAVHEPCSQRNVLKNQQAVYQLLNRISGAEVISAAENHLCCGAGGTYMLSHPQTADQLRDRKLKEIMALKADYIVSANIGCAMHLNHSAADAGRAVLHPISLLARLLEHV